MMQKPERDNGVGAVLATILAALIIAVLSMPILYHLGVFQLLTDLSVLCAKAIFRALGYPPV